MQPGRHARRLRNQKFDVETKIGNSLEIAFQHPTVARKPDRLAVILHFLADEAAEIIPVLRVQAGDVAPVEIGKILTAHGIFPSSSLRKLEHILAAKTVAVPVIFRL